MKYMLLLLTSILLALPIEADVNGDFQARAKVSNCNSSMETLGAGEEFTGCAEGAHKFSMLTVFTRSDVPSATNGLKLEVSADGVTWGAARQFTLLSDSLVQVHTLVVTAQFYRVRFVNGSTPQGTFQVQTIFHPTKSKHLTSSVAQNIGPHTDVEFTRLGSIWEHDVAQGLVNGAFWLRRFGQNPDVGASPEAVWNNGGDYTGFLQSAAQLEVLSSDNNDGAGSATGALTVKLLGLDANFDEIEETVTMNGTTPVSTVATNFIRLNHAYVVTSGSCSATAPSTNCTNIGTITVRVQGGGAILAAMPAAYGETTIAGYTVPNGYNAFLVSVEAQVGTGGSKHGTVTLNYRENVDDVVTPFTARRTAWQVLDYQGEVNEDFNYSVTFPEKTDVWFSANRTDNNDIPVAAYFELLLVPNSELPPLLGNP